MAAYSKTPLVKKLGYKPGYRVKTRNTPANYARMIAPLPADVRISAHLRVDIDIWHLFTSSQVELVHVLEKARNQIKPAGMIWVSWPKKASGVPTDVSEDIIRTHALPLGLVDVKVCAIDDVWSGLKLVIRNSLRS